MKVLTITIAVAGLLLGTAVVGAFGFAAVGRALFTVGWTGFAAVVAYHLAGIGVLGLCWYLLAAGWGPPWAFVWGRLIRDSGSEVLPLSQVGGYVMGVRAASLLGVPGPLAAASTIADVTLEVMAQIAYTLLGLAVLATVRPDSRLVAWFALGVGAGLSAIVAFIAVQRRGLAGVERLLGQAAAGWLSGLTVHVAALQQSLDDIYRRPGDMSAAGLLHVAAWLANGAEAWIALRFMGAGLDLGRVVGLESLLYAIRSVAFAVPNAVGVQEGAYAMLGAVFGLPPETALALSLLKRARDLVIGVPALFAWQFLESRRLLSRSLPAPD